MAGAEQVDSKPPVGDPKFHDETLMPVRMGVPYRVPDYAYPNWGLVYRGEEQADAVYRAEWAAGNSGQLGFVEQATTEAGLGNFPEFLRRHAGKAAGILAEHMEPDRIRIMDIGAGPGKSAEAILDQLPTYLQDSTELYLVDPSVESLTQAYNLLADKALVELIPGSDTDVLGQFPNGSFDIMTAIASVHHHARIPFKEYLRVLKPGGFLVLADWHQPIWEHPGSVFQFLEQMDWPKKEEGLKNWLKVYPNAKDAPPLPENPADRKAIEQITAFWSAYQRIQNEVAPGANAIWPLEGHRPVQKYAEGMRAVGFSLNNRTIDRVLEARVAEDNPHQILPDSSLLQLTIGQKI